MEQSSDGQSVGSRMGDYVWDGKQWVPYADSAGNTFDGARWNRPPAPLFPPLTRGSAGLEFADPRYAYGLTRRTSDDLQFIARYTKVMIILGLVVGGIMLVSYLLLLGGLVALLNQFVGGLPR